MSDEKKEKKEKKERKDSTAEEEVSGRPRRKSIRVQDS